MAQWGHFPDLPLWEQVFLWAAASASHQKLRRGLHPYPSTHRVSIALGLVPQNSRAAGCRDLSSDSQLPWLRLPLVAEVQMAWWLFKGEPALCGAREVEEGNVPAFSELSNCADSSELLRLKLQSVGDCGFSLRAASSYIDLVIWRLLASSWWCHTATSTMSLSSFFTVPMVSLFFWLSLHWKFLSARPLEM